MAIVWYVLIHVSLGLIGYEAFRFTNLGALYAAAAAAVVQGYAMWETHRIAWPRFNAALAATPGSNQHRAELRQYWKRMARLYVFRISAFAILTLMVATLVRAARSGG